MSQRLNPDAPTLAQSVGVELAFGIVGLTFIAFTGRGIAAAYSFRNELAVAIPLGLVVGVALGLAFGYGVTRPGTAERVAPFLAGFTSARPTLLNFGVLGLAAALGEESLFRAALQPSIGIVPASLLFMAAHSLIADFGHPSLGKVAYAGLAFGMGLLLGWLYMSFGIAACMSAHFAFDTAALYVIRPLLPVATAATAAE